jgi:hypothetical protein
MMKYEVDLDLVEALGREIITFQSFVWKPGMLYISPSYGSGTTGYIQRISDQDVARRLEGRTDVYPVLTDPATLGILEHDTLAESGMFIHPLFGFVDDAVEWPEAFELIVPFRYKKINTYPVKENRIEAIVEGLRIINEYGV